MASPANLCDRCHKNRAGSFRLTKTIKGNSVSRQYCERCAAELELSADDGLALALFPWEEAGPYQVSAETEVTNVQPERAALRVRHSSYYPVGTELFITPRYLPPGLRRTNKTVCFNLPLEHAKLFFPGSNPTAVGGSQDEQVGHRSVAFSATGIPGEWVKRRVDRKGLASLDSHIREALSGHTRDMRLVLANLQGSKAISLIRDGGTLFLSISTPRVEAEEDAVMRFFEARRMRAERDRLSSANGVPGSRRRWDFRLSQDPQEVSALCKAVFSELYKHDEDAGIEISVLSL